MEEIIKLCAEKGINVKIENIEELRGIGITFSKNNKYYKRIIPYDEIKELIIPKTFTNLLIKEAEKELDH